MTWYNTYRSVWCRGQKKEDDELGVGNQRSSTTEEQKSKQSFKKMNMGTTSID